VGAVVEGESGAVEVYRRGGEVDASVRVGV
jgi:hypothetical protein